MVLIGSVSADLAVVPRDQIGITISAPQSSYYRSDLATDGLNYLSVWVNGTTEYAQLLDSSGSIIGSPVQIFTGTYGDHPAVAYGGSTYLVIDTFNSKYIRGSFIDLNGNPGPVFEIGSGINTANYPDVAYDPISGNFLVVWGQYTTLGVGAKSQIFGQFVNPTTGVTGAKFQIGNSSRNNWHPVVTNGSGQFFVAYTSEEYSGSTNRDVYGARVNSDGSLPDSPDIQICTKLGGQDLAAWGHSGITYDGINYIIVWRDCSSYPEKLFAARISPDGILIDGPAEASGKLLTGLTGISSPPGITKSSLTVHRLFLLITMEKSLVVDSTLNVLEVSKIL